MFPYLTEPGVGLLLLFAWALTAAFVLHDISKYSDKAWTEIGESKLVWQTIGAALAWPVGAVVYFLTLRPRLETLVEADRKEQWMLEYEARQAAAARAAAAQNNNPTPPASAAVSPQPAVQSTQVADDSAAWTDPSAEVLDTSRETSVPDATEVVAAPEEPYDQEKDN